MCGVLGSVARGSRPEVLAVGLALLVASATSAHGDDVLEPPPPLAPEGATLVGDAPPPFDAGPAPSAKEGDDEDAAGAGAAADDGSAPARLVYSPGPWAEQCPRLGDLEENIAARLGRRALGEPASRVVTVVLVGPGGAAAPTRAHVQVVDAAGTAVDEHTVVGDRGCAALVDDAVDVVARSLASDAAEDPLVAVAPAPTDEPAASVGAPRSGAERDDRWLVPSLGGDVHLGAGVAPAGLLPGLTLGAGLRAGWIGARVEGRVDLVIDDPESDVAGTDTSALAVLVAVVPCVHVPVWDLDDGDHLDVSACATGTAGVVPVAGRFVGLGPYVGAGGRAGFDVRTADATTLRLFLQVEGAIVRTRYDAVDGASWVTPPFNVMAAVAMDVPGG